MVREREGVESSCEVKFRFIGDANQASQMNML